MAETTEGKGHPFLLVVNVVDTVVHGVLALAVACLLLRRCYLCGREVRTSARGGGRIRTSYFVVLVCTTWTVAAAELLLTVYLLYLDIGSGWSRDAVADAANASARAVAWILLAAYLTFEPGGAPRFPAPLGLWWPLFMLLSFVAVGKHLVTGLHGVPGLLIDAITVIPMILLSAGFLGRRDDQERDSADFSENLLQTAANEDPGSAAEVCLLAGAGFLSVLTFSWVAPLLALGNSKTLGLADVPGLSPSDSVASVLPRFEANLKAITGDDGSDGSGRKAVTAFMLTKALVRTMWLHVALTALCAVVYNIAIYAGPYLMDSLVQYLSADQRYASKGQALVLAFIVAKLCEFVSQRHWYFWLQQAGIRAHSALVGAVYKKGLMLSSQSKQSTANGGMINIISVDAESVRHFCWYMHDLWMVPLQVSLALSILYPILGLASLVTLCATAVLLLVIVPIGKIQQKFQQKLMHCKDDRMKSACEILHNVRILRLQCWEMFFLSKIIELRKKETNYLKKCMYTSASATFSLWTTPTMVAVATYGACLVIGIPLEAGKILSALATFRILHESLHNLPERISMLIRTKVSLERIASFLRLEEVSTDSVQRLPSNSEFSIEVNNGNFSWDASSDALTLENLNLQIRPGMRVAVCGAIGSGKSSLLSCILGEIPKLSGEVKTSGMTAYVSQSAWIQTGKIQENILFGNEMDNYKYQRVLEACSLKKDLDILPMGDQTIVGERGVNLSGGQKQRIQIARALYQDADIYLLDDPFSAVDAHTGSHLFKECLLGVLASKTVVYVTHQLEFLPAAHLILVVKDGRISQAGNYNEIKRIISEEGLVELADPHKDASCGVDVADGDDKPALPRSQPSVQNIQEDENAQSGQLVQEEEREKGRVGFSVYWNYLTLAYKGGFIPVILIAQVLFQVLQMGSNYWMTRSTPVSKGVEPPVNMSTLLTVYLTLACGSSLCILVRQLALVIAAFETATMLFNKMHTCIFRAPMSFFDSTPSGRILNRASTDQSVVDTTIAEQLSSLAFSIIELIGIIFVMSHVAWQVFVVFILVVAACIWYQQYYIDTSRELQRIAGVSKAPITQHFAESVAGSTIIRSFSKKNQFVSANSNLLDAFARPKFYNAAAMEWLCFRLDVLSSLTFAISLILLVSLLPGLINPAVAGLAVTYGLNLNLMHARVVWSMCILENKMISVERIMQYASIPAEAPLTMPENRLAQNWPSKGEIQLHDLHVKYAPQLPYVLKGLSLTFTGGIKTGIVGRSGSGKSTLIQALFRIVDPTIGHIDIDAVDICTIGLHDLRSRLSIIPQEPVLFEGTIRTNLDPLGEYTEEKIWEALDCCQLGDVIRNMDLKLDSRVLENGENWSLGQRQLVCLGRVILKQSKILVLDEATASVDAATDILIRKTIQQQFSGATVITIAHRITSILNSDRVLLLDNGVAVEHDKPAKLLNDKASLFSKLVAEFTSNKSSHQLAGEKAPLF